MKTKRRVKVRRKQKIRKKPLPPRKSKYRLVLMKRRKAKELQKERQDKKNHNFEKIKSKYLLFCSLIKNFG